jgi:hypothetical protein
MSAAASAQLRPTALISLAKSEGPEDKARSAQETALVPVGATVVAAATVVGEAAAALVGGEVVPADVGWSAPPQPDMTTNAPTAKADTEPEMFRLTSCPFAMRSAWLQGCTATVCRRVGATADRARGRGAGQVVAGLLG